MTITRTYTSTFARYPLGRLAAEFPVELSAAHNLMELKKPARSWAGPKDSTFTYGMLGNTQYGDCTFAAFVHLVQAICILLGITPPDPTAPEVIQAYLLFCHGKDSGAVEAQVLQALYMTGIIGINVVGYALGRKGINEQLSFIQTFGAAYLGVMMPMPAQEQFQANEPWELTDTAEDTNIEGGHAVVAVSYDQTSEMITVLTWGRRQKVTFAWMDRYLDEQWAVMPKQIKDAGGLDNVNWSRMDEELRSISGAVGV